MKACIFDFDGTLVDSMSVWSEKMMSILRREGVDIPEGLLRTITPLGDKGTIKYFRSHFALKMTDAEMLNEMHNFALPKYRNEIPAKNNAKAFIKELFNAGSRLFLLTASPHSMFEPCLERLKMLDYFEDAWSCSDFNTVKSDPEIYHLVSSKIGTNIENCVLFDDNLNALKTAASTGMKTIGVFDESSQGDIKEIQTLVDLYLYGYNTRIDASMDKLMEVIT